MNEKTIYLGLGSNLGEREDRLSQSLVALEREGISVVARSAVYETEPLDVANQPWFLNMVIECQTRALPMQLMKTLLRIEREIGRVRNPNSRRGPRPIDLDILLIGESVIDSSELTVPHPRMFERRFVLEPLLEIAPNLRHPVTREPLRSYLAATLGQQVRLKR